MQRHGIAYPTPGHHADLRNVRFTMPPLWTVDLEESHAGTLLVENVRGNYLKASIIACLIPLLTLSALHHYTPFTPNSRSPYKDQRLAFTHGIANEVDTITRRSRSRI